MITIKVNGKKTPIFYPFLYYRILKMGVEVSGNTFELGEAEKLLGHHVPSVLKKHVIQDLIEYGLLRRVNRNHVEIVKFKSKQLEDMGIDTVARAFELSHRRSN